VSKFTAGLHNVERYIREAVLKANGGDAAPPTFCWHRGKKWLLTPSSIDLEVSLNLHRVTLHFTREEIEEACQKVTREDTINTIETGVRVLA